MDLLLLCCIFNHWHYDINFLPHRFRHHSLTDQNIGNYSQKCLKEICILRSIGRKAWRRRHQRGSRTRKQEIKTSPQVDLIEHEHP